MTAASVMLVGIQIWAVGRRQAWAAACGSSGSIFAFVEIMPLIVPVDAEALRDRMSISPSL
jgi:hypothetical protein